MNFEQRLAILNYMGQYLKIDSPPYQGARNTAYEKNKWFLPEYIFQSGAAIADHMLSPSILHAANNTYQLDTPSNNMNKVGIIMAGNIPWVGLQDVISVLLSGHNAVIKTSSKDGDLIQHLIFAIQSSYPEISNCITFQDMLKGCDAYLATGSDHSARHFEYYFRNHPHLIRKNRTSIALLDGTESENELAALADDIQLYFGLGCRNVTQVLVPKGYDFQPLLQALKKYDFYKEHDKYRNNFDFRLTLAILNKQYYMSNDSLLLIEDANPFSPISQLNYWYYENQEDIFNLIDREKIQCIVGKGHLPFGQSQQPQLTDFPDGLDTLQFLKDLSFPTDQQS